MGKLIKHEWKNVSKVAVFGLVYLLIITLLFTTVSKMDFSNIPVFGTLFPALVGILYAITVFAISFIALIYAGLRFSKNLYGDEGYLMHTLPYTKAQLVFSKGLIASFWLVLISIASYASIAFQVYVLGPTDMINFFFITDLDKVTWQELSKISRSELHLPLAAAIALIVVLMIVHLIMQINALYAAISVGQLWSRHTTAGTILFLFLEIILYGIGLGKLLLAVDNVNAPTPSYLQVMLFLIGAHLVIAFVTFLISTTLMKLHLNLK